MKPFKIGEVSKRTGISIRMLRYYEEVDLLSPRRSQSGYRLYDEDDVVHLCRITQLRQLGLEIEEVRQVLTSPETDTLDIVQLHRSRVQAQILSLEQLSRQLERLERHICVSEHIPADELLQTIEMITTVDKIYSSAQIKQIEAHRQTLDPQRVEQVAAEWPLLVTQVRDEMKLGTSVDDPRVQTLAHRWAVLVREMTDGDSEIEQAMRTMLRENSPIQRHTGIDAKLFEYIQTALNQTRVKKHSLEQRDMDTLDPAMKGCSVAEVRERMGADLREAIRARDRVTTAALRSVLAALDNASAVTKVEPQTSDNGRYADQPRRIPDIQELHAIFDAEVGERQAAIDEYKRLNRDAEANRLQSEVDVIMRYIKILPHDKRATEAAGRIGKTMKIEARR
jgi:DNA-binding transcriptional MerR regulator